MTVTSLLLQDPPVPASSPNLFDHQSLSSK
jgi:hypothetical protein